MKVLVWAVTAVVLLLGTVAVAMAAAAAGWLAGAGPEVARSAQSAADAIAQMPVPPWLGIWVDTSWLEPMRAMLAWSAVQLAQGAPWLTPLLGWVAPVLWVLWAVVAAVLLALAGGLHWLIGRAGRLPPAGRPPVAPVPR